MHKDIDLNPLQNLLCGLIASLFLASSASLIVRAANVHIPANKIHTDGKETAASGKKKSDAYLGWQMYQNSKSMGTNRLMLCSAGMKIVNPLMSMAYWPQTNQLVLINNSNHKYFTCTREKFPHYVQMLGFDIYATVSKDIKYSEWKKLDTEKVASMNSVLYERQAINLAPGSERKEQTWVSSEISLPDAAFQVYSQLSGRPDACRFGFPMRSKVITNFPPDGFKVHVDFDTKEVTPKHFVASDFLVPKDYIQVKEFSEFLLNDSESKMAQDENIPSGNSLHATFLKLKAKNVAKNGKEVAPSFSFSSSSSSSSPLK